MQSFKKSGKGFTLVELLVVMSIMALLIGVLLPALTAARMSARSSACLSNVRQIGVATMAYGTDNKGYYPTSYYYENDTDSSLGYNHWSGLFLKYNYFESKEAFVCPEDEVGGWAPTDFTPEFVPDPPAGQTAKNGAIDDAQAPRLSYIGNEVLIPRYKYSALKTIIKLARSSEVSKGAGTIMFAEFTDVIDNVLGSSPTGGDALKTHRPTHGIRLLANAGKFDGELYDTVTGIESIPVADAKAYITTPNGTNPHIQYISPERHRLNSNYTFADGHGEPLTLAQTLDEEDFRWGLRVYTAINKPWVMKASDNTVRVK